MRRSTLAHYGSGVALPGHRVEPGDVLIVEPGEDHHLEAVSEVVVTWLHLAPDHSS